MRVRGEAFAHPHSKRDGNAFPKTRVKETVDVAIIGGGPGGLSALHALRDRDVVLLEKEPQAALFIISRDTDFDPLVEFLNARGHACRRVKSVAELVKLVPRTPVLVPKSASRAAPPTPAKKAQSDRLAPIIKHLHSLRGKPSTRKTLATTIANYFKQHGGALGDKVVEQLIDELIRLKYVSQSGPKVAYHLS
jgi:protoporphyrinogen oxidase